MLNRYLNEIVMFIANFSFVIGLWLLALPLLLTLIKSTVRHSRFRRTVNSNAPTKGSNKGAISRHVEMLLSVTMNKKSDFAIYTFYFLSFALFAVISFTIYRQFNNKLYVFAISTFIGALPYIGLRLRLNSYRIEGSYEGIDLVSQITDHYKMQNYNMKEAIDQAINSLNSKKYSLNALGRLSYSIKDSKNNDDVQQSIAEFVFAFDTEWAQLLGMNMYISIVDQTNVRYSLEDILRLLRAIKEQVEKSKRINNEAFTMIQWFIPGIYVFFLFIAVNSFGFTYAKFFEYQFKTPMGFSMAIITFTLLILLSIIVHILKKPKYDF